MEVIFGRLNTGFFCLFKLELVKGLLGIIFLCSKNHFFSMGL